MRKSSRRLSAIVMAGITLLATGCASEKKASSAGGSTSTAKPSTITLSSASGEQWTCGFNPYNPNTYGFSLGIVNEELYFVDPVNDATTPWLATSYKWSNHFKALTWNIRKGVKFSDGSPFTAADVVYSFNLILKHSALDVNAISAELSSVKENSQGQVVMDFKSPAVTDFYYIADQTPIVEKKQWSTVKNPVTYLDKSPIGTGPYTVQACTSSNISYVKNPHYWEPGKPKFDKVEVPAILTNSVSNEDLASGDAQWGGQFIPDIKTFYLDKNKGNRNWFPPYGLFGVFPNLTNAVLKNLVVRQAIAYGIDRPRVSSLGEYGEDPAANQEGVPLPTYGAWYSTALAKKYNYSYNPKRAIAILEGAGYKRGTDGIFKTPSGQALSFTMVSVGGYSDWVADGQIIVSELKQIGIRVKMENLSNTTYTNDVSDGKFELALGNSPGRTTDGPFGMLRGLLYSPTTAPIGKAAVSDYERYSSPKEDALFNELASTTNVTKEEAIMKQIEVPMVADVPFIPVVNSVIYDEYDTSFASGWATEADPYASPGPTNEPDWAVVLLHLVPKG